MQKAACPNVMFNDRYAYLLLTCPAHTDQKELLRARDDESSPEDIREALQHMRKVAGAEGLKKAFTEQNLHVLIAPSDSMMCCLTSATGWPVGVAPLRYLPNGQPQGLTVVARPFEEHKMIWFMRAFEKTFPKRRAPSLLEEPF